MPNPSSRLTGIVPSGKDGWEVHFAAMTRKQAGEPIIMLSVGDHDFDTPCETVEACVKAVRAGHHHYTQLPGIPRLREAMARASTRCTGVETSPVEVIVTPGGQLALYAAVQAYTRPRRPCCGGGALLCDLSRDLPRGRGGLHRGRGRGRRRLPAARRGDRSGAKAEYAGHPHQHTEQPNRRHLFAREPGGHRKALRPERDLWLLSDEVYWTLGGGRSCLAARPARHGRADAGHQLHVEEPRHDRLAHRLADRARKHDLASGQPQPCDDLWPHRLRLSRQRPQALENDYGVRQIAEHLQRAAQGVPGCDPRAERHHRARLRRRHVRHARHQRDRAGRREIRLGLPRVPRRSA